MQIKDCCGNLKANCSGTCKDYYLCLMKFEESQTRGNY
jgi:hypothetical protein